MTNREAGRDATDMRRVNDRSIRVAPASRGCPEASRPRPLWATLVATFFGIGHLRPGPGTWGSAATVLLWWLLARSIAPGWQPWVAVSLALAAILAGIPAATRVARASGLKDPQFVVIDEVAGQLITLIAAPVAWQSLLLGFILFRAFDIVKPPPVRQLERLPEGWASWWMTWPPAFTALAVMQIVLHFGSAAAIEDAASQEAGVHGNFRPSAGQEERQWPPAH